MPDQHHTAYMVADIAECIAGRFGQSLTRWEVVTISRKPKRSLVKFVDQLDARAVAAGLGDIDGELRQGFP
jgi:hypothetical protein